MSIEDGYDMFHLFITFCDYYLCHKYKGVCKYNKKYINIHTNGYHMYEWVIAIFDYLYIL